MIKVSVLYPKTADSKFDIDYYCKQHMPMVKQKLGAALKGMAVDYGVAGGAPLAVEREYDDEFLARRDAVIKGVGRLIEGANPLELAAKMVPSKRELQQAYTAQALEVMHLVYADALRYALTSKVKFIKNKDIEKIIKAICNSHSVNHLLSALDAIRRDQQALGSPSNPNPQLLVEALLVELAGFCAL